MQDKIRYSIQQLMVVCKSSQPESIKNILQLEFPPICHHNNSNSKTAVMATDKKVKGTKDTPNQDNRDLSLY